MASKPDISTKKLAPWDEYKNKEPDEILASTYAHVDATSSQLCNWYWSSIGPKRITSQLIRGIAISLGLLGATLPLVSAFFENEEKLFCSQFAVICLAIAGLLQIADRVFGWSSGWMRYITTVTAMENHRRTFQLEWAAYLINKSSPPDGGDAKTLFDLAKALEQKLAALQEEETNKWVAEFNAGISILESVVKTQRDEADKKLELIRGSLAAELAKNKSEENFKRPGALEVTLRFNGHTKAVKIAVDNEALTDFVGSSWCKLGLSPGQHLIRVITTSEPVRNIERAVDVSAGAIVKIDVDIGG
jgi:hypothetical protein